jgi:hypothetical protein
MRLRLLLSTPCGWAVGGCGCKERSSFFVLFELAEDTGNSNLKVKRGPRPLGPVGARSMRVAMCSALGARRLRPERLRTRVVVYTDHKQKAVWSVERAAIEHRGSVRAFPANWGWGWGLSRI